MEKYISATIKALAETDKRFELSYNPFTKEKDLIVYDRLDHRKGVRSITYGLLPNCSTRFCAVAAFKGDNNSNQLYIHFYDGREGVYASGYSKDGKYVPWMDSIVMCVGKANGDEEVFVFPAEKEKEWITEAISAFNMNCADYKVCYEPNIGIMLKRVRVGKYQRVLSIHVNGSVVAIKSEDMTAFCEANIQMGKHDEVFRKTNIEELVSSKVCSAAAE